MVGGVCALSVINLGNPLSLFTVIAIGLYSQASAAFALERPAK